MNINFRTSRKLMWAGTIAGIFIFLFGIAKENELYYIIGTAVILITTILYALLYRCPNCGYPLINVRGEIPEFCPKCGLELTENKN